MGGNWLPNQGRFKVLTQTLLETRIIEFRDLIDKETKVWNQNLLEYIFLTKDKEVIKDIPLQSMEEEDVLSWAYNPNEQYTVKFGYNCIQMWNKEKKPQGSSRNKDDKIWKNL